MNADVNIVCVYTAIVHGCFLYDETFIINIETSSTLSRYVGI